MKVYFGTNLKMYKNICETTDYLKRLADLTKDMNRNDMELFIIPSYTSLASAALCTDQKLIRLGSQNMSLKREDAG